MKKISKHKKGTKHTTYQLRDKGSPLPYFVGAGVQPPPHPEVIVKLF